MFAGFDLPRPELEFYQGKPRKYHAQDDHKYNRALDTLSTRDRASERFHRICERHPLMKIRHKRT